MHASSFTFLARIRVCFIVTTFVCCLVLFFGQWTASPTPFRILAVWVALSRVGQFGAPTWALTLLLGFGAVIVPQ